MGIFSSFSFFINWCVTAAEYAFLLRIPLISLVVLCGLPWLATRSSLGRPLFRGMFDLKPWSLFFVTVTAAAVAETAITTGGTIIKFAHRRFFGLPPCPFPANELWWILFAFVLYLPLVTTAIKLSWNEGQKIGSLATSSTAGVVCATVLALFLQRLSKTRFDSYAGVGPQWMNSSGLFRGYVDSPENWHDHQRAIMAFLIALLFYLALGMYGWWALDRKANIPALCSALMTVMLLCWGLTGVSFFLDAWHIPLLLPLVIGGFLTARSSAADHYYELKERVDRLAPTPGDVLSAKARERITLVAANGGGIQAAAWTAKVLAGLSSAGGKSTGFADSLCMISSVSGGSVGSVYYLDWLSNEGTTQCPYTSASRSSLDDLAWGLAWPDFMRGLCPWLFRVLLKAGRGSALERAWCRNSTDQSDQKSDLKRPLSCWNANVRNGQLPAVILNATVAETGDRLLIGTTQIQPSRGRLSPEAVHGTDAKEMTIVTGARLSATFPFVTPASRADLPGPMAHVVDGGYYDNYGMATLVEWLEQALADPTNVTKIRRVLVVQILGAKIIPSDVRMAKTRRGWFYQTFAPLQTVLKVREAGQITHNDIEFDLLQKRWKCMGVEIEKVEFEFNQLDGTPPLSWHLTSSDIIAIDRCWEGKKVEALKVQQFLTNL